MLTAVTFAWSLSKAALNFQKPGPPFFGLGD